jgi:hypothetical protein
MFQKSGQGTKKVCQGTKRICQGVPRGYQTKSTRGFQLCKWVPRIAKRLEENFKSVTRELSKEKEL